MGEHVGIVGGTGPMGRGLASRFVVAGVDVTIGSRERDRAQRTVDELTSRLADVDAAETGSSGRLTAGDNVAATDAPVVIVTIPYGGLDGTVAPLAADLVGRVVVSTVNPLGFDDVGPFPLVVDEGSAAQRIAALAPQATVVAAFHSVASGHLEDLERPLEEDVLVAGDDEAAVAQVVALADRIAGCRGVAAGPLRLAASLEAMTAVVLSVNRRYRARVGVRLHGLDRPGSR